MVCQFLTVLCGLFVHFAIFIIFGMLENFELFLQVRGCRQFWNFFARFDNLLVLAAGEFCVVYQR